MDIKDSKIEQSIIAEAIGETAKIDAGGSTNVFKNHGSVFNQCIFENGAGWEVLNKAQEKFLGEAQFLVLKGDNEQALRILRNLLDPSSFEHLSEDIQFRTITLYCDSLFFDRKFKEALETLSALPSQVKEDYRFQAWLYLIECHQGNEGAIEMLSALFEKNQESPLLTHLCLLSENSTLGASAEKSLLEKAESLDAIDIQKYRRSIVTLVFMMSSRSDFKEACRLLKIIKSVDKVERYKLKTLEISIEIQIILEHTYVASGYHLTVTQWREL